MTYSYDTRPDQFPSGRPFRNLIPRSLSPSTTGELDEPRSDPESSSAGAECDQEFAVSGIVINNQDWLCQRASDLIEEIVSGFPRTLPVRYVPMRNLFRGDVHGSH